MERIWDGFKFGLGFSLAMGLLYVTAVVLLPLLLVEIPFF